MCRFISRSSIAAPAFSLIKVLTVSHVFSFCVSLRPIILKLYFREYCSFLLLLLSASLLYFCQALFLVFNLGFTIVQFLCQRMFFLYNFMFLDTISSFLSFREKWLLLLPLWSVFHRRSYLGLSLLCPANIRHFLVLMVNCDQTELVILRYRSNFRFADSHLYLR